MKANEYRFLPRDANKYRVIRDENVKVWVWIM